MKQISYKRILRQRARSLGFGPLYSADGRATVADLVPGKKRMGVYLLGFRTGEAYVGLTKDVVVRFIQHRHTHEDIEWFAFKLIPASKLVAEERRCIESVEQAGLKLRNVALTSFAPPTSDLDAVVSRREQRRFLSSGHARPETEDRPRSLDLRRKYLRRFGALMAHLSGLDAVFGLASYLRLAFPCAEQTQLSFWSATALPGRGVLIRVNTHWQEVFTASVRRQTLSFSLHLARKPLAEAFGRSLDLISKRLGDVRVTSHRYLPGGPDQMQIIVEDRGELERVLAFQPIRRAIREFNLRLMRKGPSMWARMHCPQLVDVALRLS